MTADLETLSLPVAEITEDRTLYAELVTLSVPVAEITEILD